MQQHNAEQKERASVITFDCFTQEQVKEINKKIKENISQKEEYKATVASKTGHFFHVSCVSLMEVIHPWLYSCQQINRKEFGYDIYWDFHLEFLNYNVYGTGGEYDWHIDRQTREIEDMKLTCLLNLSEEPYEGGEFHTISADRHHEFPSGSGLVLNSLVAHKVSPVTKGERITLTYWGQGPSWK